MEELFFERVVINVALSLSRKLHIWWQLTSIRERHSLSHRLSQPMGAMVCEGAEQTVTVFYQFSLALIFFIQLGAWLPFWLALRRPFRVADIRSLGSKVIVKTEQPHSLAPGRHVTCSIHDTGDPRLDQRRFPAPENENFVARAVDCVRLELVDMQNGPSASMGTLLPRFPEDVFRTSIACKYVSPAVHCATTTSIAVMASCLISTSGMIRMGCGMEEGLGEYLLVFSNMLGPILAGLAAVAWRRRQSKRPSQLQRAITQFRRRLLSRYCPTPRKPGPFCATSVSSLEDFHDAFSDFIQVEQTYYVVSNIISPLTRPEKMSLAELLGPLEITFFVSYAWIAPFQQLVTAVREHARVSSYGSQEEQNLFGYWICCFSCNGWQLEMGNGDLSQAPFCLALGHASCRGLCLVMDEQALPLTRGWTVMELWVAVQNQVDVCLCGHQGVVGDDRCSGDFLRALGDRLRWIDLSRALCSDESDRSRIMHLVEQNGGTVQLQEKLSCKVQAALDQRMHEERRQQPEDLRATRKRWSEEAGISASYLLSDEFLSMAEERSRKQDPTFYDLIEAFFFSDRPIGKDIRCPRDNEPGCAFVDALDMKHQGKATNMLSWSWGYPISQVRGALLWWMTQDKQDPDTIFLHMSALTTNHYRLPSVYSCPEDISMWNADLRRIGSMVVLLDTWDMPSYLQRIWTVSEIVMAVKLQASVRLIWPSSAQAGIEQELLKGPEAILRAAESLGNFAVEKVVANHEAYESSVRLGIVQDSARPYEETDQKIRALMFDMGGLPVKEALERKRQSEEAGIGAAYLLSDEFLTMAQERAGTENPKFYDLEKGFFFSDRPIGQDVCCPRDGRPGCALVDALPARHRGAATHFLSWSWAYSVGQIRSALASWLAQEGLEGSEVFLYMCFFVNNQYRILIEQSSTGSDNLELLFESNLRRIGRVVALLDTWNSPIYLTRVPRILQDMTSLFCLAHGTDT